MLDYAEIPTFQLKADSNGDGALSTAEANAFLDVLDGKAELLCSLAEGAHTLRVNLAVLDAAEGRRWVDVPAE